ncbi:hypothetical protein B0T21DRAFT_413300 [Apiosordaria backusii]|uniref:DNA 3'-5' helicase n=1 Tax=Apiosordaria backusii TaxID=314023 RepID=A0AA40B7T7_9PEZI|nr:hypothetical protein B0T21DRAFT_413300 [Apiosordaria backusii]
MPYAYPPILIQALGVIRAIPGILSGTPQNPLLVLNTDASHSGLGPRFLYDPMTRNNLSAHLSWLLRDAARLRPAGPPLPAAQDPLDNIAAVPAATLPLPPPPAGATRTSRTTSSSSFLSLPNNSSASSASAPSAIPPQTGKPTQDPTHGPASAQDSNLAAASSTTNEADIDEVNGMAKLSSCNSHRPTLATKQQQLPTPAPTRSTQIGSLQRAYSANAAVRPKSRSSSPPPVKARVKVKADLDDFDDPMIDLTEEDHNDGSSSVVGFGEDKRLWREDYAERPEPIFKRGQTSHHDQIEATKASDDVDEYPDINELVQPSPALRSTLKRSATTPSVIKTHAATPCPPGTSRVFEENTAKGREAAHGNSVIPNGLVSVTPADPAASTSARKRKSPAAAEFTSDDFLDGEIDASCTPANNSSNKRIRRTDVVYDSEDEFTTPESHGSPEAHSPHEGPGMDADMDFSIQETPSKAPPPKSPPALERDNTLGNGGRPTAVDNTQESQPSVFLSATTGQKPASESSFSSEIERNKHILSLFLSRPSVLQEMHRLVDSQLKENAEAFKKLISQRGSKEERERIRSAKKPLDEKKRALAFLQESHVSYKKLSSDHESLIEKIGKAYCEGLDTEEDEEQLQTMEEEIETVEKTLISHLIKAGIDDLDFLKDANDSMALADSSPRVPVVLSTQTAYAADGRTSFNEGHRIPEYNSLAMPPSQLPSMSQFVGSQPQRPVSQFAGGQFQAPVSQLSLSQQQRPTSQFSGSQFQQPVSQFSGLPAPPAYGIGTPSSSTRFDVDEDELAAMEESLAASQIAPPVAHNRPSAKAVDTDEYEQDVPDDLMLAAYEQHLGQSSSVSSATVVRTHTRTVLSEATGNTGPTPARRAIAKLPAPLVRKTPIPPELLQFPWSADVLRALKDRFRLVNFRHNQLPAINCTLGGNDAFVMMPTGGGKSLCYQLPAVVQSGKTKGLTVVVSPLLSLMSDQVAHMKKLNIHAVTFNSNLMPDAKRSILNMLHSPNPEHFVQLLYVTPEMLANNNSQIRRGLTQLHKNGKFARLVIDEAHCVSQWGHDFRPDYKALGDFRKQFPGVPVIALTASATQLVQEDVQKQLGMLGCPVFSQSFNRPNLYYEVFPKPPTYVDPLANLIMNRYMNQTGIIYTTSRASCEGIAEKLRDKYSIKAAAYHAGLDNRLEIQQKWQADEIRVIVATIAFGMGIDKPNVRFVIHVSLPKTLEGYYQETGRAGRDGKPADCILYFSYGDVTGLRRMVLKDEWDKDGKPLRRQDEKDRQCELLDKMSFFCVNTAACRRVQLLGYFGEEFDAANCNKQCDYCLLGERVRLKQVDRTDWAKAIIDLLPGMGDKGGSIGKLASAIAGRDKKSFSHLPGFGVAPGIKNTSIYPVILEMERIKIIYSTSETSPNGGLNLYYHVERTNFKRFWDSGARLKILVPEHDLFSRKCLVKFDVLNQAPPSTNVSSPVTAPARKRPRVPLSRQFIDDEADEDSADGLGSGDEDEDDEDSHNQPRHPNGYARDNFVVSDQDEEEDFEPTAARHHRTPSQRQQTLDELRPSKAFDISRLHEVHQAVMEQFVYEAKQLEIRIRSQERLTRPLFTEQQYREMIARWTTTPAKMYTIRGVTPDKVDQWGSRFVPLIQKMHQEYEAMMADQDQSRQYSGAAEIATEANTRKVDPVVVSLLSDDEDDFAGFDDEEAEEAGGSGYHAGPRASEVEAWHRELDEMEAQAELARAAKAPSSSSYRGSGSGSRGGGGSHYKKKGGRGGGSGGGNRRNSGGVTKRGASASRSTGGGSRGKSKASSSRSGIMAMPR